MKFLSHFTQNSPLESCSGLLFYIMYANSDQTVKTRQCWRTQILLPHCLFLAYNVFLLLSCDRRIMNRKWTPYCSLSENGGWKTSNQTVKHGSADHTWTTILFTFYISSRRIVHCLTSPISRGVYWSSATQCILVVEVSLHFEQKGKPQQSFSVFSAPIWKIYFNIITKYYFFYSPVLSKGRLSRLEILLQALHFKMQLLYNLPHAKYWNLKTFFFCEQCSNVYCNRFL